MSKFIKPYYNLIDRKKCKMQKSNSLFKTSQTQNTIQNQQFADFNLEIEDQSDISANYVFEKKMNQSKLKKQELKVMSWTLQDEKQLINLHKAFGNKWTLLSKSFPGSCQNFIKNHFYSRLRKSIRKLNKYISIWFPKKYNKFNLNIIFKLSNISENKIIGKCDISDQITIYYKDFIYMLIDFSENQDLELDQRSSQEKIIEVESLVMSLIALENLFRIISGERVYKGKKKNIAYLKRFTFKLNSYNEKTLVITKEKCYISKSTIEIENLNQKLSEQVESPYQNERNNFFSCSSILQNEQNSLKQLESKQTIYMSSSKSLNCSGILSGTDDSHYEQLSNQIFRPVDELKQLELMLYDEPQDLIDKLCRDNFIFDI